MPPSSKPIPSAIRTEMKTVGAMIDLFCVNFHRSPALCASCAELKNYARLRLEYCRFGAEKPACVKCPVHCYKPEMRAKIREVMRHAGPKMLISHPWLSLIHLWKEHGFLRSALQLNKI